MVVERMYLPPWEKKKIEKKVGLFIYLFIVKEK